MAERKTEAINLRMAAVTKDLLRLAAAKERRTLSNMIDFLIHDYCARSDIAYALVEPALAPLPARESKGER